MQTAKRDGQNSADQRSTNAKPEANAAAEPHILQLQRKIGNQAVMRMLGKGSTATIQRAPSENNVSYMADKLATGWQESNKRMESSVANETRMADQMMGKRVSQALGGAGGDISDMAIEMGKGWWKSYQRLDGQLSVEGSRVNSWLDVLQHERTADREK